VSWLTNIHNLHSLEVSHRETGFDDTFSSLGSILDDIRVVDEIIDVATEDFENGGELLKELLDPRGMFS
jgi:hypothetical protein